MHPTLVALLIAVHFLSPLVSAYTTSARCSNYGDAMSSNSRLDIYGGINRWFQFSSTGASCKAADEWTTHCQSGNNPPSFCSLDGAYSVWDTARMTCNAYNKLRTAALSTCGGRGGYGDCSCGVYATSSSSGTICLIATYSYHLSGTAVQAPNQATAEPETPGFNYNGHTEFRRAVSESEEKRSEAVPVEEIDVASNTTTLELASAASQNLYPFVKSYNAEGSPAIWTLGYLGSCSSIF